MRYLLDTNVVSDLVRNPQGKVAQRIRKVGEGEVCTSIIVAAELRYGAANKGSPRLSSQLEVVLGVLEVSHVEDGESERFEEPSHRTLGEVTEMRRVGADLIQLLHGPSDAGPGEQSRAAIEEPIGVGDLDHHQLELGTQPSKNGAEYLIELVGREMLDDVEHRQDARSKGQLLEHRGVVRDVRG